MKQLTCEMCGSTELVKDGGFFICQTCGTKYSVEEAKKMMIEGTVDVQGTVKVDNSAFIKKYLSNARRAMKKEDWEEAERYYNMVEQNEPSNIEAIFYSSYSKARILLIDSDYFKREHAFTVLCNTVSIIDDNYTQGSIDMVEQISDHIDNITSSNFIYKGNEKDKIKKTYELFSKLNIAWVDSLFAIAAKTDAVDDKCRIYKRLTEHYVKSQDNNFAPPPEITYCYKTADKYLMKFDPTYKTRRLDEEKASKLAQLEAQICELEKKFNEEKKKKQTNSIALLLISFMFFLIPLIIIAIWQMVKNNKLTIEQVYPKYRDLKKEYDSIKYDN